MASGKDPPFTFGDPGGGRSDLSHCNKIDGTYTGRTLPAWMDCDNNMEQLTVLRMEGVNGALPKHPFILRTSVENCIEGKIEGAFPEGRGTMYALKVRNPKHVQKLLAMKSLTDGTPIKISKHPGLNSTRCVVSCRDVIELDDNTVMTGLAHQGITAMRRITKKIGDRRENTPTIILTIEGTKNPEYVDFGWVRCKTRRYYPTPMQCFKCWNFGHTKPRCQQPTICGNCSQQHCVNDDARCEADCFCIRCNKSDHALSSRKCPVYEKENAIQKIRVDQGISYPAAKKAYEQCNSTTTYANIASASKDQKIAELSSKVDHLLMEMKKKDKRIEALESTQHDDWNEPNNRFFVGELLQKVDALTNEMKKKDDRILALEAALGGASRMDKVRKHGTIDDLITKVSNLQETIAKKEKEILILRDLYDNHRTQVNKTSTTSPTANFVDLKTNTEEWIEVLTNKTKKKQNRQQNKTDRSPSPISSDDSSASLQSTCPNSSEKTPKRTHSLTESDNDSTGRPRSKVSTPGGDVEMLE